MRRTALTALAILEFTVAGLVVYLAATLPSSAQVSDGFDRVEATSRRAGNQVGAVRRQVREVRRPEVQQLAERLKLQTESVSRNVKSQRVDFDTVVALRDSFRDIARGVDGAADALDAEKFGQLGVALGETAKYLDERLIPGAGQAADQLEALAAALSKDAAVLTKLLREAPPDLKAARDIHDSLGRFDDGLDKMLKLIELKRLGAIKEGFAGMESSLETTAQEVERLAGYKYPHIKVRGLKVEVEERPFWQSGDKIAEGLRKATGGVRAAQKEIEGIEKEMPGVRLSLEESRKVVARTREALGRTLAQQDKLDPLLRDIPTRTAALAEALPKLAGELAKVLRDTQKLRDVSAALKQAQAGIDGGIARWPDVQRSMRQSARVLRTSSEQLDRVVRNREDYEASVRQSTELADTFAAMAPLITDQVSVQLGEQEKSLGDLEKSLDEVGDAVPAFKQSAVQALTIGRALLYLMAGAVAAHGVFVLGDSRRSRA